MHLTRGNQATQNLAHLAAGGKRGQEQLDIFHTGGDHGLQVDGCQHGYSRDLRGGGTLGNSFLVTLAEQLPLSSLARGRNDGDNAKLLPKLGDSAQNSGFGHFSSQCAGELAQGCVTACVQQLVSLNGQLRNLARTCQLGNAAPVTVAAQGINVRKNPAGNHEIRRLAWQAQQIQPHNHAVSLQTHQQLFGYGNIFTVRSGLAPADYSLNK
jgi:hypothetical protein